MLFDCDMFINSFNAGHCAFEIVCSEEKCPFVLLREVKRLRDEVEEWKESSLGWEIACHKAEEESEEQ